MVPCQDIYGDDPELERFFINHYENSPDYSATGWLCFSPTTNVIVQNDPWVSSTGIVTSQHIFTCESNVLNLDNSDCISDVVDLNKFAAESQI